MNQRRLLHSLVAISAAVPQVRADLEVGTFFGANWLEVEGQLRAMFRSSLNSMRKQCAAEATCSKQKRRFCGFEDNIYDRFDEFAMGQSGGRHVFDPDCAVPHFGQGCFFDMCMDECFTNNVEISRGCQEAMEDVRTVYAYVNEYENMHDGREAFFRGSLGVIAALSMVASGLVILLMRHTPSCKGDQAQKDEEENDEDGLFCAQFCLIINWVSVFLLLGFVVTFCPMFLVVLVPPFAFIQLMYYLCSNHPEAADKAKESKYQRVVDDELENVPKAFVGIPVQA